MMVSLARLFVAGVLLMSLTIYVLLGGADYGSGVWYLLASGPRNLQQREFMAHAIGPIWEADHVWLILIVVILFTGFPTAFSTIMTALDLPLTLMLIGIVLRGAAFGFRTYGSPDALTDRRWSRIFGRASLITPALLGMVVAAIASGKLPQNPQRISDFVLPWLTPFCLSVGGFTVTMFAYLSATYASYEARDSDLAEDFRVRAICAALCTGAMAGLALLLSINGAPAIWHGRVWTRPLFWITAILAMLSLHALGMRHYRFARFCAAGGVTLILWGWAFAQFPYLVVPTLTIYNSSAAPITIELLASALLAGSFLLLPSYKYLLEVFKSSDRPLYDRILSHSIEARWRSENQTARKGNREA
jgi:cytochrome bd ubiquinol oxidase subunit II